MFTQILILASILLLLGSAAVYIAGKKIRHK